MLDDNRPYQRTAFAPSTFRDIVMKLYGMMLVMYQYQVPGMCYDYPFAPADLFLGERGNNVHVSGGAGIQAGNACLPNLH